MWSNIPNYMSTFDRLTYFNVKVEMLSKEFQIKLIERSLYRDR